MIFDIQRFSTHDGPGIRTVVFFKGCPLACPWCENPESQSFGAELLHRPQYCVDCVACLDARLGGGVRRDGSGRIEVDRAVEPCADFAELCPSLALRLAGREARIEEILAVALKDEAFYAKSGGGVTFSGGEPFAQGAFLEGLAGACAAGGLDTAVETCLALPWEAIRPLLGLIDHWLVDLKHVDGPSFRRATGGDLGLVLGNIGALARAGVDLCLRVPVIPGFNADEASMRGILAFAAALPPPPGGAGRKLDLLAYHDLARGKYESLGRPYPYAPGTALEPGLVESYTELGRGLGLDITIGG